MRKLTAKYSWLQLVFGLVLVALGVLTISYYRNGKILEVTDRIKKIDPIEKKLVLCSRKTIMLKEIVSIIRNDEGGEL